jgi:hypothetical protein
MNPWLLLLIPGFAIINHFRGGGVLIGLAPLTDRLPGRPIFWAAPLAGLLSLLVFEPLWAAYFGFCYLIWGIPPWGRWFDLERMPDAFPYRPLKWEERITARWHLNDYWAFTLRNSICWVPTALISPWFLLLGPIQTGAYEVGWRVRPFTHDDKGNVTGGGGIPAAELIFGAVIGCSLFIYGVLS